MQHGYNDYHGNQDIIQLFTQRVLYKGDINHDKSYEYQQASACTREKGTPKNICIKTLHIRMVMSCRNWNNKDLWQSHELDIGQKDKKMCTSETGKTQYQTRRQKTATEILITMQWKLNTIYQNTKNITSKFKNSHTLTLVCVCVCVCTQTKAQARWRHWWWHNSKQTHVTQRNALFCICLYYLLHSCYMFQHYIMRSSGSWYQNFYKTYRNKIGHNGHTYTVI
jgi:hypothetical protein